MDGAQVGVLKQTNKVRLSSLLESKHSMALETQISLQNKNGFDQPQIKNQIKCQNTISYTSSIQRYQTLKSCAISLTSLWKGSFLINSSVLFWYLRISLSNCIQDTAKSIKQQNTRLDIRNIQGNFTNRRATVPGR